MWQRQKDIDFRASLGAGWDGKPVDVDDFWADAWAELRAAQDELAYRHKLNDVFWEVNQETGLIEFHRHDGALLSAPVQIIGSWNPKTSVFHWGWDHPSVQPRLRGDAERTRWFGQKHALDELTKRSVIATEREAWGFTALALKVNGKAGAYRGPTEGPVVFMTIDKPTVKTVLTR